MSVTINGATGVDTPGLESTAMPTVGGDAVVESGSNSDGEWTRWGDGTQQCVCAVTVTMFTAGFQNFQTPAAFDVSNNPVSGGFAMGRNPTKGADSGWWDRQHQMALSVDGDDSDPAAGTRFSFLFRPNYGGALTDTEGPALVLLSGRWK